MTANILAIVAGIGIPLIALLLGMLKCRRGFFVRGVPDIGENPTYYTLAGSTATLRKLIKAEPGAHLKVSGSDFAKWTKDQKWLELLGTFLKKNVKISAYGTDVHDHAKVAIDSLRSLGMKVSLVKDLPREHWLSIDKPRQLWYEQNHDGHYAENCVFTTKPREEVWEKVETYFSLLEKTANN